MANIDGIWDCVIASPMGEQKSALAINSSGDEVAGTMTGASGSIDIENGKTDGDRLSWTMNVTSPMPVTLDCAVTVDGDSLKGTATAGAFGSFPLTGTRRA